MPCLSEEAPLLAAVLRMFKWDAQNIHQGGYGEIQTIGWHSALGLFITRNIRLSLTLHKQAVSVDGWLFTVLSFCNHMVCTIKIHDMEEALGAEDYFSYKKVSIPIIILRDSCRMAELEMKASQTTAYLCGITCTLQGR